MSGLDAPEELFNRPMEATDDLLWVRPGERTSLRNWDVLASENAINAAISQDDESGEIKKGAHEYEAILKECGDGVILDLGCGYGRVAKHVLPLRTFRRYIGLDQSDVMLAAFARRYRTRPEEQRTPLMLVRGPIDDLPFSDGSIDAVVTSAVWIHNPKRVVRASVAEVLRVLKPGGKLLVFGSFLNARNPANWQERLYSETVLPLLKREGRNGPVRVYAEKELRDMFSSFSDSRIIGFGCRIVPNHLLALHRMLNLYTWKQLALPLNRFVANRFGTGHMPAWLRLYHDVIAVK